MKLLGRGQDPAFWAKVRESEAYRPYREELLKYYNENVVNYDYHALRCKERRKHDIDILAHNQALITKMDILPDQLCRK